MLNKIINIICKILQLFQVNKASAQWTLRLLPKPRLNALCVKVMANITRQRSNVVIFSVLQSANRTLVHTFKRGRLELFVYKASDNFICKFGVILALGISLSEMVAQKSVNAGSTTNSGEYNPSQTQRKRYGVDKYQRKVEKVKNVPACAHTFFGIEVFPHELH